MLNTYVFLCLLFGAATQSLSYSFNHSCDCYSCSSSSCIEGSENGVSFKIWFVDLAGTNTNVAQVMPNTRSSIRISGSVKANGCFGKCTSQLIVKNDIFQEHWCGQGNWDFDKTIHFTTPSEGGMIYDTTINQGSDVICKENPENVDSAGDVFLLASMYVVPPTNLTEVGIANSFDDELISCDSLKCPSICHVVPKKYIPNKSVYHMTYRNLAIAAAVGAAITFALSTHFLKTAVTFSNPWKPPPPSLANAWLGSAAVTVGASLLAQYWLSSACHGELLSWGAGFSSVGALSCLLMFGFHIQNRCAKDDNKKKRRKKKKARASSSDSQDSQHNDVGGGTNSGAREDDRGASLLENEHHLSSSVENGSRVTTEDSETDDTDDENVLYDRSSPSSRRADSSRGSGRRSRNGGRRRRGTWIVQVSSAYVRIVSGGLESLPGVPNDDFNDQSEDTSDSDIVTTTTTTDGVVGVVPNNMDVSVIPSDGAVADHLIDRVEGGHVPVHNNPIQNQVADCVRSTVNDFDEDANDDSIPVASAVAIFA